MYPDRLAWYTLERQNGEKPMTMIEYPEPLPEGRTIEYVSADNPFMQEARAVALSQSLDHEFKTGSVIVNDGKIIGSAANGSDYHLTHVCERVRRNIPTGQGYELCEGCHPKNHSEPKAIQSARAANFETAGSDIYLWGHWWICAECWKAINEGGIRAIFLLEKSDRLFNKKSNEYVHGKY